MSAERQKQGNLKDILAPVIKAGLRAGGIAAIALTTNLARDPRPAYAENPSLPRVSDPLPAPPETATAKNQEPQEGLGSPIFIALLLGSSYVLVFTLGRSLGKLKGRSELEHERDRALEMQKLELRETMEMELKRERTRLRDLHAFRKRIAQTGTTLLVRNERSKALETGLVADPDLHNTITPVVSIDVRNAGLVGVELPLVFKVTKRDGKKTLARLEAKHKLELGPNLIFPSQSLRVQSLPPGEYRFQVILPADFAFNNTLFKIGKTGLDVRIGPDGVVEYNPNAITPDMTLDDLMDLANK